MNPVLCLVSNELTVLYRKLCCLIYPLLRMYSPPAVFLHSHAVQNFYSAEYFHLGLDPIGRRCFHHDLYEYTVCRTYLCPTAGFWRKSRCLSRSHTANQILGAVGGIFYRSASASPPPTASRPPCDDCGLCFWWPPVVLFVLVLNLYHCNDQGMYFCFWVNYAFNHWQL